MDIDTHTNLQTDQHVIAKRDRERGHRERGEIMTFPLAINSKFNGDRLVTQP